MAERDLEEETRKLKEVQMKLEEERQVQELKKLQEDSGLVKKGEERLDWMYQGVYKSAATTDEFLTGKKVEDTEERGELRDVSAV